MARSIAAMPELIGLTTLLLGAKAAVNNDWFCGANLYWVLPIICKMQHAPLQRQGLLLRASVTCKQHTEVR